MMQTSIEIIKDIINEQTSADYVTAKNFLHSLVYKSNRTYPKDNQPVVYIISGGISAGKSTLSYNFLKHYQNVELPFLGNDTVHEVYFKNHNSDFEVNYNKAREFVDNAINLLISNHSSFIWETVFSKDKKIDVLKSLKENGYRIILLFVGTELLTALARNKIREQLDGNIVDDEFIKDRYEKVLRYYPLVSAFVNEIYLFSNEDKLELVFAKDEKTKYQIQNIPFWAKRLVNYET